MPVPVRTLNLVSHEFHWEEHRQLPLRLLQGWHPHDVTAASTGPAQRRRAIRADVPKDEHALVVLSEHPDWGTEEGINALVRSTKTHEQVCIAPIGQVGDRNRILVFLPGVEKPIELDKLSLSYDDVRGDVTRGDTLHLFLSPALRFVVLNCHEYSHADLVTWIATLPSDLAPDAVVVVTRNRAASLYSTYALSDVHRLFAYVIVGNIAQFGGSSVFAPFRRLVAPQAGNPGEQAEAEENHDLPAEMPVEDDDGAASDTHRLGGRLIVSEGPGAMDTAVDLDIRHLRQMREALATCGDSPRLSTVQKHYFEKKLRKAAIVPPEHLLAPTRGPWRTWIGSRPAEPVRIPDAAPGRDKVRVAIAQLDHAPMADYLLTNYRFGLRSEAFIRALRLRLHQAAELWETTGEIPDLLVLPEVFVPRCMLPELRALATRLRTIIVTGLEYRPLAARDERDSPETPGENQCIVIAPSPDGPPVEHVFTKLTRSQYDARLPRTPAREKPAMGAEFQMSRGERLLRLQHDRLGDIGVLICYDLSHHAIVHALNDGAAPCDVLVVSSWNPFGELYRACAQTDAHRYFQYVLLCNVADYGSSGIFGPRKGEGPRLVLAEAGRGVNGLLEATLDIKGLKNARSPHEADGARGWRHRPGICQVRLNVDGRR